MDATTRLFILMIVIAIVGGLAVITIDKNYRVEKIYQSNASYYPSVTDQSVNAPNPSSK